MARPTWSGVVSFGLVSVPVKAYTATRDKDIRFHRIERARISEQCRCANVSAVRESPFWLRSLTFVLARQETARERAPRNDAEAVRQCDWDELALDAAIQ